MSEENGKKLIWFQHFHKAGGTSVISAAEKAGWTLYPDNANGNPLDINGGVLPIWEWDKYQLSAWLDEVIEKGVDFIACEWGFSHAVLELDRPDIHLLTVLRHPIDRLISNFYYDVQNKYTRRDSICDYMEAPALYAKPDYYTHIISGYTGGAATELSFSLLRKFDSLCFLGNTESFADLEKLIPGVCVTHTNRTSRNTAEFDALQQDVDSNLTTIELKNRNDILLYDALLNDVDRLDLPHEKNQKTRTKPISEIIVQIGPDIAMSNLIAKELNGKAEELIAQNTLLFNDTDFGDSRDLISLCDDESMDEHSGLEFDRAKRRERRLIRMKTAAQWEASVEKLSPGGKIVVSSHCLATELVTRQKVEYLNRLLSSATDHIKVILYLPRQDRLAIDIFNDECRRGMQPPCMINPNSPDWAPVYNFLGLSERWRNAFNKSEFKVQLLHQGNDSESLLSDFFSFAGIDRSWKSEDVMTSPGKLSDFQQRTLLMVNQKFPDSAPLRRRMIDMLSMHYPQIDALPTREQASRFYGIYRKSNELLAKTHLGETDSFDTDFSEYPESVEKEPFSDQMVSDIMAICGEYFSNCSLLDQNPVNPSQPAADILRDLGIRYMEDHPQLALVLLEQARKLRPRGPRILEAINLLKPRLLLEQEL